MNVARRKLQQQLDELRRSHIPDLSAYRLSSPPVPPGLYWKARWLVGCLLRGLEALRIKPPDPWPVRLRQASGSGKEQVLLIWAVGAERDALREACRRFGRAPEFGANVVPVLVTDVADFAFFSRLRWLVEYVPSIADGADSSYARQKSAFLADLYRDARVVPVQSLRE